MKLKQAVKILEKMNIPRDLLQDTTTIIGKYIEALESELSDEWKFDPSDLAYQKDELRMAKKIIKKLIKLDK